MRGVQLTLPLILPERGRSSCSSGGTPCGFCCAACLSVVAWCLRVHLALYSDSNENCLTSLFTIHTKHLSVVVARQRTTTKSIVTVQNLWPHLCCHGCQIPLCGSRNQVLRQAQYVVAWPLLCRRHHSPGLCRGPMSCYASSAVDCSFSKVSTVVPNLIPNRLGPGSRAPR